MTQAHTQTYTASRGVQGEENDEWNPSSLFLLWGPTRKSNCLLEPIILTLIFMNSKSFIVNMKDGVYFC